jgi:hypothetical protein
MLKSLGKAALVLMLASSVNAFAANSQCNCKKNSLLADPTLSEPARKELKEYYEKTDKMYEDFRKAKEELRVKLSKDAQDAMKKHYARKQKHVDDHMHDAKAKH